MTNKSANTGFSIYTLVFIIFLILKLTDNIDWSWWWVTSPLWIPVLIIASVFIVVFLLGLVYVASTGNDINELVKKITKKD